MDPRHLRHYGDCLYVVVKKYMIQAINTIYLTLKYYLSSLILR